MRPGAAEINLLRCIRPVEDSNLLGGKLSCMACGESTSVDANMYIIYGTITYAWFHAGYPPASVQCVQKSTRPRIHQCLSNIGLRGKWNLSILDSGVS